MGASINDDARLEHEADVMGARARRAMQHANLQGKNRSKSPEGSASRAEGVIQGDFLTDYQKHLMLKTRTQLPGNRRIRLEPGRIVLEAEDNTHTFVDVGRIDYSIGPLLQGYYTAGLQSVPGLMDAPALFLVSGFYSNYENQLKGVGGAMLNAAVKLAEMRECPFFVVLNSINDEAYEAFGFKPADKAVGTWYASTAFMKTRTKSYATPTTGAQFV